MSFVKSAAVPHYSKANGKIVFAVRVCPLSNFGEPFTIYRRWDEFVDFSSKLGSEFPTTETDDRSAFRRIPRLSRKVTLFSTASTHNARKDELDLFVRHLFNLPQAVITCPLVRDFFSIKHNGLDGGSGPSPQGGEHGHERMMMAGSDRLYATVKERSPHPPMQEFRPSLSMKRSTPDLRRFVGANDRDFDEGFPTPSPAASAYPAQLSFRFPNTPGSPNQFPTGSHYNVDDTVRYPLSPNRAPKQRAGVTPEIFERSMSPADDKCSIYTSSTATVRPARSGSNSRMASPLSFNSSDEDDYVPPQRPGFKTGSLKHFRSLQDIRAVIAPHPQVPLPVRREDVRPVASNLSPPPSMARSYSENRVQQITSPPRTNAGGEGLKRSGSFDRIARMSRPSLSSMRQHVLQYSHQQQPSRGHHQHTGSTSSVESADSSTPSMTRSSRRSSAGLGLDFSSASSDSLELGSELSLSSPCPSNLGSPDSSFGMPTPSPHAMEHAPIFEKWQQDSYDGNYTNNNMVPPLPFFPIPSYSEPVQSITQLTQRSLSGSMTRRHGRNRASSLHQPVLETILASPDPSAPAVEASITLKVMTGTSNIMLKIPKSSSLSETRARVIAKCISSQIALAEGFALGIMAGGSGTEKAGKTLLIDQVKPEPVKIEDEEDWQTALRVATTKITLRVI